MDVIFKILQENGYTFDDILYFLIGKRIITPKERQYDSDRFWNIVNTICGPSIKDVDVNSKMVVNYSEDFDNEYFT